MVNSVLAKHQHVSTVIVSMSADISIYVKALAFLSTASQSLSAWL